MTQASTLDVGAADRNRHAVPTLIAALLGFFTITLDAVVVNVALPTIRHDLGGGVAGLQWVVDGYTLAIACLVLPAGAVGDRYGRRGVLIAGLAVFAAASVVPLAFDSPWWLIGARAAAGVGAALVMPSTLSILTGEFGVTQRQIGGGDIDVETCGQRGRGQRNRGHQRGQRAFQDRFHGSIPRRRLGPRCGPGLSKVRRQVIEIALVSGTGPS